MTVKVIKLTTREEIVGEVESLGNDAFRIRDVFEARYGLQDEQYILYFVKYNSLSASDYVDVGREHIVHFSDLNEQTLSYYNKYMGVYKRKLLPPSEADAAPATSDKAQLMDLITAMVERSGNTTIN